MKYYFYIGGMPEAVSAFISNNDFNIIREIHQEILRAYELDFSKHVDKSQVFKITDVWHTVATQLAKENKKFVFSLIKESARAREYESAISWLHDAGLINLSYNISTPKIHLSTFKPKLC